MQTDNIEKIYYIADIKSGNKPIFYCFLKEVGHSYYLQYYLSEETKWQWSGADEKLSTPHFNLSSKSFPVSKEYINNYITL
ncbi:MAG: hypothetical protein R3321_14280, partial [Nitrososphaeraceae archaeon]|nr:hypothetical protein [Nitrososphaeraceae archaeon]